MSCSSDEQEFADGGKAIVYGNIVTRATNNDTYVGAIGDNELIKDWWVVFVNPNNIIEKIVSRDSYKNTAVKREGFQVELNGGTYTVYTFANISRETVEGLIPRDKSLEESDYLIKENATMPDLTKVKFDVNNTSIGGIANGTLVSKLGNVIPMSGKVVKTFSAGLQNMDFEVVRMVAKMDFIFKNMCASRVTIKSLHLSPINEGVIPLIPNTTVDAQYSEKDPTILEGVAAKPLEFDFTNTTLYPTSIVLEANSSGDDSKWYTHSFYVRESSASTHPTKHFKIELTISGRDDKTSEALYTITDKLNGQDFTGFNRNDYIQIPIVFTDYRVGLLADSYAPIGGYPTEITENNKNEFYCKFAHQGEFMITPYINKAIDNSQMFFPDFDYEIVSIDDPDEIFVEGKEPTKNTITGETTGKLNTNEGTASVYIHIGVWTDTGHTVKQDFYRRIYVIRKNP